MPGRLHDPEYGALIEHLTDKRKELGVTQLELAARLGKPQSFVSKFERLERRLDVAEWRNIAIALEQSPIDLFREVCELLDGRDRPN